MAEIPVHKKSGIAWWIWLVLALIVAALLWWLFAANDNDDVVADRVVTTEQVMPVEDENVAMSGSITTLAALMTGPLNSLVGRSVDLTGVPVQSLAGDQAFWVGDNATNRALVVFDEMPTPNKAMEGNVDVNPGSMVTLHGTVRSATDKPVGATLPAGTDAYIFADSVNVK